MKSTTKNILTGLAVLVIFGVITWGFGLFSLPTKVETLTKSNEKLSTEVNSIRDTNAILEQKYSYLVGYLSGKFNINLAEFINISLQKKLSQQQVSTGIYLLSKDPTQAKAYLSSTLNFSSSQIELLYSPPNEIKNQSHIPNIKLYY